MKVLSDLTEKMERAMRGKLHGEVVTVQLDESELGAIVFGMYEIGRSHADVTRWLEESTGVAWRTLFVQAQTPDGPRWVRRQSGLASS